MKNLISAEIRELRDWLSRKKRVMRNQFYEVWDEKKQRTKLSATIPSPCAALGFNIWWYIYIVKYIGMCRCTNQHTCWDSPVSKTYEDCFYVYNGAFFIFFFYLILSTTNIKY